jgi:hypothetical protein
MPFYEIIYETGNKSVAFAESDEEMLQGAQNHHERALKGEPGRGASTPRHDLGDGAPQVQDYPAERIVKILRYDKHPGDLNEDMTMSADVLKKELEGELKGKDVVNLHEVAAAIRELANPHDADGAGKQESQYKMKEDKELELPWAS